MRASVYIATSYDGFIARPNGDLDWLPGAEASESDGSGADGDGEDYGYAAFIASVDHLVMGRNSFEKILSFGGDWPYQIPVIVLTSKGIEIPSSMQDRVEVMFAEPTQVVETLAQRGAKHLYIDGGLTIQRFLRAGIIDRLIISRVPVLLGQGIPLFGALSTDIQLKHIETRSYESGVVQSEFNVL